MNHVHRIAVASVCASIALTFSACGGPQAPMRAQTSAVAAVRSAEELGAERYPRASYHLELAHEQLQKALALIEENEDEEAAMWLRRAQVDAELAMALSREAAAAARARDVQEQIHDLRESQGTP
jgi:hypothetical protein